MIEIQDHQQAMKLANPIVDLEETVRRGINDPLADPQFVMNRINKDYFHLPLVASSRENKELLSYQGFNADSQGVLGVNGRKLTPSAPTQEKAVKEQYVAKTPSIFRPIFQQQQQQQRSFPAFSQQQQRSGGKILPLRKQMERYVNGGRRENVLRKLRLLKRIENENTQAVRNSAENINPLTGLPEDLEASSYGAVASITAVSDNHNARPATVTVDLTKSPYKHDSGSHHESVTTNDAIDRPQSVIAENSSKLFPGAGSSVKNFIDNNTDLKAFLEADTILREKLNKDGIGDDIHSLQKRNKMKSHKMMMKS